VCVDLENSIAGSHMDLIYFPLSFCGLGLFFFVHTALLFFMNSNILNPSTTKITPQLSFGLFYLFRSLNWSILHLWPTF
jgi:hypothetical protein